MTTGVCVEGVAAVGKRPTAGFGWIYIGGLLGSGEYDEDIWSCGMERSTGIKFIPLDFIVLLPVGDRVNQQRYLDQQRRDARGVIPRAHIASE